jgi:hypothetical protein
MDGWRSAALSNATQVSQTVSDGLVTGTLRFRNVGSAFCRGLKSARLNVSGGQLDDSVRSACGNKKRNRRLLSQSVPQGRTACSPARECRVGFHLNRVPKGRHNAELTDTSTA